MKRTLLFLILMLVTFSVAFLNAQVELIKHNDVYLAGDMYAQSYESPFLLRKGDQVRITNDSFYLVNAMRMNFYKTIHQMHSNNANKVNQDKIIALYATYLRESEHVLENFYSNQVSFNEKTNSFIQAVGDLTISANEQMQEAKEARDFISLKINNLEEVIIKEQKKNRFWRRFNGSIMAVAAGVVVGIVITNNK